MPSYTELMRGFEFGPWRVLPERGLVRDGEDERHVEPIVMDVFVVLASHGGDVVTKDQLIDAVWDGRPQTDDVITRCISSLRRVLGDDARNPSYIETVQRRGYRVMQPVTLVDEGIRPATAAKTSSIRTDLVLIGVGLVAVLVIGWYALIRNGDSPGLEPTSVAVFPFECLQDANDPSEHLCFGFAEQAISALNQVEGFQIVRKRDEYDADEVADEDSLVTGSVQIIGDAVRVTARLENVRTGVVIWSQPFDNNRDGIFDLQRQVADGLRGALDEDFVAEAPADTSTSFAAMEAYAVGRYIFEQRDHDRIEEAIDEFQRAIDLDPSFGPAWLGLAYTYSIWPDYDLRIDRLASFEEALTVIANGVENDPSIRESAGTVYGYVYHKQNRWADAMENTLMAVNGASPTADDFHWHSRVLASVGRMEESAEYARRGVALDPEYPVIISRLAIASFWINDLNTAERYFDIANRMELEASIHSLAYSLYLIRTGRIDDAKVWAKQALAELKVPTDWVDPVFDGIDDPAARDSALGILDALDASGELPANVIMTLSMLLGDVDRAMRVAQGIVTGDGVFEIEILFTDEFRAFREHPDFERFVNDVGLADYWASAGCRYENDEVSCGS
jgi:DNA-binding winged helix-turn-helix (wHTH) protein/TolB-like protein/Tfp pilus assembly protein PilF